MLPFLPGRDVEQLQQLQLPSSSKETPELVFFGRLEVRKGIKLLCDALDIIAKRKSNLPSVTFLGRSAEIDGETSEEYIATRAAKGSWPFEVTVLSKYNRTAALTYLKSTNRIAVR